MIRVLLVDDSQSFRLALGAVLRQDPEFEVVGLAKSGTEGLMLARTLRPDLVVMDLVMPGMNGLEATHALMREVPCPVVIVSSLVDTNAQQVVFEALRAGAVEVMKKPRDLGAPAVRREMLETLRAMAKVAVVQLRGSTAPKASPVNGVPPGLVVIGASTGGPPALSEILRQLPATFPWPIVVAQHLASGFSAGLCQWLQGCTALPVHSVDHGMRLMGGSVYLAPDDHHLELAWPFIRTIPVASSEVVSPSVDRLFGSARGVLPLVAVLLTGMGEDGARALKDLHDLGAHTLVQDEGTSLVWGMPRVARELGAAREELSLSRIGPRLLALSQA